jgi:hypothetical protein
VDYSQFVVGIQYFNVKWPSSRGNPALKYASLRRRGDNYWLHLENLSQSQIKDQMLDNFLNTRAWNCHIPPGSIPDLKRAVDQVSDNYAPLRNERIEETDFQKRVTLKGTQVPIADVIDSIVSLFRQIKPKFGLVPASKLMHMAIPDLFVMLDRGIRQKYNIPKHRLVGFDKPKWWYVGFLVLMQEQASHITETYPGSIEIGRQEAIAQIRGKHSGAPIPRLLDMANMAVRDGRLPVCETCMTKVKARWNELR